MKKFNNKIKKIIHYKNIKAFTLAEVLITLGIIGVVACFTIPALISSIQDYQLKQAWKKEYSVMSQAVSRMVQDNGGSLAGLFTTNDSIRDNFKQYLNVAKSCNNGASFGDCWASNYQQLKGGSYGWGNTSGLILDDGASIMFENGNGTIPTALTCSWQIPPNSNNLYICGYAPVDVNGPTKGPNIVGRDIFSLWILQDKILPEGCAQDGRTASPVTACSPTGSGSSCSAVYLYN